MLIAFTFRAKPGREHEFEEALNNPESGRDFARMLGATRNTLFLKDGRMIRIMEIPDEATPPSMGELAVKDPNVYAFLKKLGSIIEDGFDIDRPETLDAFNRRATFRLAYDVRP